MITDTAMKLNLLLSFLLPVHVNQKKRSVRTISLVVTNMALILSLPTISFCLRLQMKSTLVLIIITALLAGASQGFPQKRPRDA